MNPSVLVLCDDLIFSSKITTTARALGLPNRVIKSAAAVSIALGESRPSCLLVDLHLPGLEIATVVGLAHLEPRVNVIGFGSHVDVGTLKAARAAGCDRVLPRSQFVADLETQLPVWANVP